MNARSLMILGLLPCLGAGEELPYGHPRFVPSPERPIGWRGDGSGVWPGAYPPFEWDDPTIGNQDPQSGEADFAKALDAKDDQTRKKDRPQPDKDAGANTRPAPSASAEITVQRAVGRNILWKTRLPDFGHGAPIVVGERVFVTAEKDRLLCLSAADGRLLWQDHPALDDRGSPWGGMMGRSMPTPCSDGQRVYHKTTTGAIICYDLDGTRKWKVAIANLTKEEAIPSPVLVDGKVIVKEALGGRVLGLEAATGKELWVTDLSKEAKKTKGLASNFDGYAVMRVGRRILLVDNADHVLDAQTGKVVASGLAHHDGIDTWNGLMNCSIPGKDGINLFAHQWRWAGFKGGHTAAYLNGSTRLHAYRFIDQGDQGITAQPLWQAPRDFWGSNRGVTIAGDQCYWVGKAMQELTVLDLKSGDCRTFPYFFGSQDLGVYGNGIFGNDYQPSVSDGYLLIHTGGSGLGTISLLAPTPRLLTTNRIDKGYGGAALHGGRLFFHSRDHVYCIADLEAEKTEPQFDEAFRLVAEGKEAPALDLLGSLARHAALQVRYRALRSLFERFGPKAIPIATSTLAEAHPWLPPIIVEVARRQTVGPLAEAVAAALPNAASPTVKAFLLRCLAVRGEALPTTLLLGCLNDADPEVRAAAQAAAAHQGTGPLVQGLLARHAQAEDYERRQICESLQAMPGPEVDAALAASLQKPEVLPARDAALLLGRRHAVKERPALLARKHPALPVRLAAAAALQTLAQPEDAGSLLEWLIEATTADEESALLSTLTDLLRRHSQSTIVAEQIGQRLAGVKPPGKRALLALVLGRQPSVAALKVLKDLAAPPPEPEVATAVAQALVAWPTAEARPLLTGLVKTGNPQLARSCAYLGLIHSILTTEKPDDSRVRLLDQLLASAPVPADRQHLFEACVQIQTIKALDLVTNALARGMGGADAVRAIVRLSPFLLKNHASTVTTAIKSAIAALDLSKTLPKDVRTALQAELNACLGKLEEQAAALGEAVPTDP